MNDPSSSATGLAWLWVIEYLASFPEIESLILHDLIEAASEIPDGLGKNTREMVALRCLEDLFCRCNGITNDVPSKEPKVTFDLSESCVDVLQSILHETSVSDLKRGGPEQLKWDIHPFIMHKRASMPKCALEKVKDAILEGIHPYALLKEYSGLVNANDRCNRISADYGNLGLPAGRIDESDTNGQINAPEENLIPLLVENENGVVEDNSLSRNPLNFKRDRSGLISENLSGDCEDQDRVDDGHHLHPQAKRLKQDALRDYQSLEQISTPPPQHMDLVEDSFDRVIGDSENKNCHVEEKTSQGGFEGSRSVENDHDECVSMDRHGQSLDTDNAFHYNQHEIAHNANKKPQYMFGDGLHLYRVVDKINDAEPRLSNTAPSVGAPDKVFVNENKDNSDLIGQLKPSNIVSSNGFHQNDDTDEREGGIDHLSEEDESDESDKYEHESVDVGLKKSQFLSSQCTLSHDFLAAANWTDQNLCIKCSKDGQLLVCNAGGCPLAVHENCLGSFPHFDERGDFYCPFCAYSLAIPEYLEAKKKASLARKELKVFIEMCQEYHSNKHTQRVDSKRHSSSRQNGDEDLLNKFHENENLVGKKCNRVNTRGHISEGNDHQCQQRKGKEKLVEPSASCIGVNSVCREEEPDVNVGTNHISNGEKEGEEMLRENSYGTGHDRNQNQLCVDSDDSDDDQLRKEKEIVSGNQTKDGQRQKAICATNIDGGETSDDENDKSITSNYFIRFRKIEKRHTYPAMPQMRRKKVPWTAQEEEILKEGLQKFSSDGKFAWKDILEYGSSVFFNGRTTIDLKDKWRNMCKVSPKSK